MDLFDWEQFETPHHSDVSELLASVCPFDVSLSPSSPQREDISNTDHLWQENPGSNGESIQDHSLLGSSRQHVNLYPEQVDQYGPFQHHAIPKLGSSSQVSHEQEIPSTPPAAETQLVEAQVVPTKVRIAGGKRLSKESVKVLKAWLENNAENPYPSDVEKHDLMTKTGLRKEQISNWLANARRRGKVPEIQSAFSSAGLPSVPITTDARAIDIPGANTELSLRDMSPLARWRNSPPEHEGASVSAISNAIASRSLPNNAFIFSGDFGSHIADNGPGFSGYRAPSISSLETTGSSGSDLSQGQLSQRSGHSRSSQRSGGHRRRRNKAITRWQHAKTDASRPYQCTFCTDSFKTKYDWQRHEKSFHLSLERWKCTPGGPTQDNGLTCAFCGHQHPTPDHLESHKYQSCADQPFHARTFFRKDHLRQHLRLFHKDCAYYPATMDNWVTYDYDIRSRCGFCSARFTTWPDRVDHIAVHFKEGMKMESWTGDMGLEPQIERVIENAIPPFVIGQEAKSLDPFSASNAGHRTTATLTLDSTLQYTSPQTCWYELDHQLAIFVREKLVQGKVPTDQEIQDHARLVVYGDNDIWNQTGADYPQWFEPWKRRVGLVAATGGGGRNLFVGVEEDGEREKGSCLTSCLAGYMIPVQGTSASLPMASVHYPSFMDAQSEPSDALIPNV